MWWCGDAVMGDVVMVIGDDEMWLVICGLYVDEIRVICGLYVMVA